MARKAIQEKEAIKLPVSKKRYYSKYLTYSFDLVAVDTDGKQKIKRNNQGTPIYDSEGNEVPIHKHLKFTNLEQRASKGYVSYFDFDPSDESAQNVELGKCLERLNLDSGVNVMDEGKYEKTVNFAAWEEKQKRSALEDENAMLRAKINDLQTPEALEKRLNELTQ